MSIYVLRADRLVKIGFSEKIRSRVSAIISGSPVPVEFVGFMPGGRDLEAHLHERFSQSRFSGEWFVETDAMRDVFSILLTPGLPTLESTKQAKRRNEREYQSTISSRIKEASSRRWPNTGVMTRLNSMAENMKWPLSRVKDAYYGNSRMRLRAVELEELEAWISEAEELEHEDL